MDFSLIGLFFGPCLCFFAAGMLLRQRDINRLMEGYRNTTESYERVAKSYRERLDKYRDREIQRIAAQLRADKEKDYLGK